MYRRMNVYRKDTRTQRGYMVVPAAPQDERMSWALQRNAFLSLIPSSLFVCVRAHVCVCVREFVCVCAGGGARARACVPCRTHAAPCPRKPACVRDPPDEGGGGLGALDGKGLHHREEL